MKKFYWLLAIVVVLGGFFVLDTYIYNEKQGNQTPALSHKDATYVIDGKVIKLTDGISEIDIAPGAVSKIVTRYFGNEVKKDLDGDGREDVVFLLTQETGGSGTFFYVVAALNKETGYEGSQGLLLGDRIAPQTTELGKGKIIVVNYADRKAGEDFSVEPSLGKSIWLLLDTETMQFGEVVQNFEGEADPKRMTLGMTGWVWIKANYNDGREIVPIKKDAFVLTFDDSGRFSATTDCNSLSGNYKVKGDVISFGDMVSTLMYCVESQETEFNKLLTDTTNFHFTSRGELILGLKYDSGAVTFR